MCVYIYIYVDFVTFRYGIITFRCQTVAHPFAQTAAVCDFHPSFFQAGLVCCQALISSHLNFSPLPGSPMASSNGFIQCFVLMSPALGLENHS